MSHRGGSRSPRGKSPSPKRASPSPPARRYSRSPPRRYSRSPPRRNYRRYSRSPPQRNYRRYSRSPPRRFRRRSPRVYGNENDRKDSTTLFVGNLPYQYRDNDVAEFFEKSGKISNITIGLNRETGHSKGYAFVTFADRRDAEEAFTKFQGHTLEGRRLRIDWDIGMDKKQQYRENKGGERRRSPRPARSPSPRRNGSRSPDKKRSRSPINDRSPDKKQKLDD